MALVKNNGNYIVLENTGHFIIFKTKKDYLIFLDKTDYNNIITLYTNLLKQFEIDSEATAEVLYYTTEKPKNWDIFKAIEEEKIKYVANSRSGNKTDTYPELQKYYPQVDVNASISQVLDIGNFYWKFDTVKEAENYAKQKETFGKVTIE